MQINDLASKILEDRNKIIDLFYKTFLVSQEPKNMEELRALFEICELECKLGEDFSQTFRIKFKK